MRVTWYSACAAGHANRGRPVQADLIDERVTGTAGEDEDAGVHDQRLAVRSDVQHPLGSVANDQRRLRGEDDVVAAMHGLGTLCAMGGH